MSRSAQPAALEFPDEQQYWRMANSLHDGDGLRDEFGFRATRMPLYPAFLSLFAGSENGVVIARVAQWVLGALAAPLTALLAHAVFSNRTAWLAGLWCAVDPFLVFFASLLLTETLSITLLCALWWTLARLLTKEPPTDTKSGVRAWVLISCLACTSVYTRESTLALCIIGMLFAAACSLRRRRALMGSALAIGFVVLSLVPWGIRNARVTGEWCWLTTRAGISLYDGVGPQATGASDLGDVQQMPNVRGLSEHRWNRYFLTESYKAIGDDPARVVRLAVTKFARVWNPFPNVETHQSRLERWISAVWSLATLGLAGCGVLLLACRKHPDKLSLLVLFLLPTVYFSVLHSLFVGSVRYRLAAMPMIEVLAAAALAAILGRVVRSSNAESRGLAE